MSVAGLILAGGRSTRFGSEKSIALLHGLPLIEHVLTLLTPDCESVAVSAALGTGAEAWAARHGLPVLRDAVDMAAGSLNGIHAGLQWANDRGMTHLAILACDCPRLPSNIVRRLGLGLRGAPGAVAVDANGIAHTLCSLWEVSLRHGLEVMLSKDRYPPLREIQLLTGFSHVHFESAFANVNTRADLDRLNHEEEQIQTGRR